MHRVLKSVPSYCISSTLKTHKKIKIYSKYSLLLYNEIINTLNFTCLYRLKGTKYNFQEYYSVRFFSSNVKFEKKKGKTDVQS